MAEGDMAAGELYIEQRYPKGFTLIELLVVITIIFVLAALLLPVLQQTIEVSKNVKCVSNLKQIGGGFYSYTEDWNGRSMHGKSNYVGSKEYNWMGVLGSFYMDFDGWDNQSFPGTCEGGHRIIIYQIASA
ncbi:MAG: prepilin-type N-terminal cleavage/methylation domain-containing protein [Planctomycetes bacterium]|nr:prepilin-type N-terminal cleavage/methylation domain-containing protein [Planctomycetota bacterium]